VNPYSEVDASNLFSRVNIARDCNFRKGIQSRDVHIREGTTIRYHA